MGGPLTLLRREAERRLRAQAWRHLRRINRFTARALWVRIRGRDGVRAVAA